MQFREELLGPALDQEIWVGDRTPNHFVIKLVP